MVYAVTAMIAQYLNVFVLIVQAFLKIPALKALAPTQTEPAFKVTQLVFLAFFVALTIVAAIRFRRRPWRPEARQFTQGRAMNQQQITVIQECASLSVDGKISFGDVVGRLMKIGLERYHADYTRHECTYYMPDGESIVVPVHHPAIPIAQEFSAKGVESAVRQAQRGEIFYPEFLKQTFAAGCIGYFVQITGRQVIYFGRKGEQHIERFPSASN